MAETSFFYGTGRRKTATARVRLIPDGSGIRVVNRLPMDDYFDREAMKTIIMQPLELADAANSYDLYVNVRGGGKTGQAGAIKHGIARALLQTDPELRAVLKKAGFLTRDARMKERKKCGQKGARAKFQFSKR